MRFRLDFRNLSHARRAAIAASCRKVSRDLQAINGQTERDFLAVGAKLEEIVGHAKAGAETISGLLDALSSEAASGLTEALDEVMQWASNARDSGGRGQALADLTPIVTAVRAPLQELSSAARMLRVAGVVTRVESARLGEHSAGFVSLADEVARLASDIDGKSESVLTAVEGLRRLIGSTQQTVLVSEQRQNGELLALLEECRAGLTELHAGQERAFAVSTRAQEGYERIIQEVGRMVVALQFHDSTRQRLEHIGEVLSELAAQLDSGNGAEASAIITLQTAQLEEARRTFADSVSKIRDDLGGLHSNCSELVQAARELGSPGAERGSGSRDSVEHRFLAVAATIDLWSESRRSLLSAAGDVAEGCARVTTFVNDIQDVGMRLLRLALNAEVEAVRLAESGAVMEAVAGGIRGVSREASVHAEKAGAALVQAEAAVSHFARDLEGGDGAGANRAQAASAHIRSLAESLKNRASRTSHLLSGVVDRGEELSTQLRDLISSITADALMERVSLACSESLAGAAKAAGATPGGARALAGGAGLAAAVHLYTMQHERDVHAAVTGVKTTAPIAAPPPPEIGLGSNVELF